MTKDLTVLRPEPKGFYLKDLNSFPPTERASIIEKVVRIERRAFPSGEAFNFDSELRKRNSNMVLAMKDDALEPVGYLVYVRMKRLALLHKICVIEQERGRGIGKCLMHALQLQLEKGGCDKVRLWVDESRKPARGLYQSCGFQEIDRCIDYYSTGRTGLKMQLCLEK